MPRDNDHDIYVPGHYTTTTNHPDNWAAYTWVQVDDMHIGNINIRRNPDVNYDAMLRVLAEQLNHVTNTVKVYPEGTAIDDETGLPL